VGVVGNVGYPASVLDRFSNSPELHRRLLEIWGKAEPAHRKQDGLTFHFSELNDGDYWFSSFYTSEKYPYSRIAKIDGCAHAGSDDH
jgi:hypothetical protein